MPIPEALLQKVKAETNLLEIARSFGLSLTPKGDDHFTRCPFHHDDTPSLSLNAKKGLFHCFGCGAKGNAIQFVQKMEGLTFPEAFKKVAGNRATPEAATLVSPMPASPLAASASRLITQALSRMRLCLEETPKVLEYLTQTRGLAFLLNRQSREAVGAGFCPEDFGIRLDARAKKELTAAGLLTPEGFPHFAGCVVFPLRDVNGEVTGLYGRKIAGDGHFYQKGERRGLFALHGGGGSDSNGSNGGLFIAESVIDALSLHQMGASSVLALHGVNGFTPAHEAYIKARAQDGLGLYLVLDGDRAGREASVKLAERIKAMGLLAHILEMPEGKDPNSFLLAAQAASPRTLKDLQSLTGYPKPHAPAISLRRDGDSFIALTPLRRYVITGLTAHGFDRLRVTLKCICLKSPGIFHIDSLDLYAARARASFAEDAAAELKHKEADIAAELKTLIPLLEEARLSLANSTQEAAVPTMSEAEKAEALAALKSPTLIADLIKNFEAMGLVSDEKAKLLGYLGTVSRLLEMPLGMLIISRSGAGKTALQDAICALVPGEHVIKYTRLTGQALFYKERDGLKYKVLAIEEEDGMSAAKYSIRTLASSQRLTVATTRSDPKTGKLKTDEYLVEGPVFILIATTNPDALDAETRSRFIILTIDESPEQTRRIMESRKLSYTLEGRRKHRAGRKTLSHYHNMQRLLKPIEVVNPFTPYIDYPFDRLQMRREFGKYMALINAITLLHQHQREVKHDLDDGSNTPYIETTVEDIALANELVLEFFPNSLDELAPHTRNLAAEVMKLIEKSGGDTRFTRKALRDFCGWTDWSIRQGLEQLVILGYIIKTMAQNGLCNTYELVIDPCGEDRSSLFLTSPDELRKRLEAARAEARTAGKVATLSPNLVPMKNGGEAAKRKTTGGRS